MNKQFIIMTSVGLSIGVLEALIYYNMGKSKEEGKFKYSIPPGPEFLKTVGVVLAMSLLTAAVSTGIEKAMGLMPKKELLIAAQ